jgi:ketosteroid isomerase-like protein
MSEQTVAALEQETRRLLEHLDAMDLTGLGAMITDDAQSIDEISRNWRRGRAAVESYLSQLEGAVTAVRSQIIDLHAMSWGDTGLVTFVLDQTYQTHGAHETISAPTSLLFRRQGDAWKVALIHSVPLPEQAET